MKSRTTEDLELGEGRGGTYGLMRSPPNKRKMAGVFAEPKTCEVCTAGSVFLWLLITFCVLIPIGAMVGYAVACSVLASAHNGISQCAWVNYTDGNWTRL